MLKLVCLGWCSQDFIFLEGLQIVDIKIADNLVITSPGADHLRSCNALRFLSLACSRGLSCSWLLRLLFLRVGDVEISGQVGSELGAVGGRALSGSCSGLGGSSGLSLSRLGLQSLELVDILAVDEIDRVSVDNSRVIRLALDFKIVRYEADGSAIVTSVVRLEWRVAELTAASVATATTWVLIEIASATLVTAMALVVIATAAAGIIMGGLIASVPLAATTAAVVLVVVASLAAVAATASSVHHLVLATHVMLVLVPGLVAAHVLMVAGAASVVVLTAHVGLVGGSLPVLAILVISLVVWLVIVVVHFLEDL